MARAAKTAKRPTKPATKKPVLAPMRRGPGRPRKLRPVVPLEAIEREVMAVEADRVEATAAYRAEPTIANKVALLETEIRVAQAHGARCRAAGEYTPALKFMDGVAKLSAQHAVAREQLAFDEMKRLQARTDRETEAVRRAGART